MLVLGLGDIWLTGGLHWGIFEFVSVTKLLYAIPIISSTTSTIHLLTTSAYAAIMRATSLTIGERIPAQRTCRRIARLEPLIQAAGVEQVLARAAALVRELFIAADNGVADRALGLALQRAHNILPPCDEAVDDVVVLLSS